MNYWRLVKDSWLVSWRHKFLWIFGLFAMSSIGSTLSSTFDYKTGKVGFPTGLVDATKCSQIRAFMYQHETLVIIIIGLILLIMLASWLFSIISQGALIGSVVKLARGDESNFKNGFMLGWRNFWGVFTIGIIALLAITFAVFILSAPVLVLALSKLTIPAIIFAIVFGLLLFIFICIVQIVTTYAYRILIIEKVGVLQSIFSAYNFFHQHIREIVLVYLVNLLIGFLSGLAVGIAILFLVFVMFILGIIISLISKTAMLIFVIAIIIVLGLVFLIFMSLFSTFVINIWTLSYLELKNKL